MSIDIGQRLVQMERQLAKVEAQSRLASASLDDAALTVRDATGSLRGIVGQQGDGTTAVNIVNGGPPPAPATPTVTPALGGVAAGWDGQFADGAIIPLDWSRVEVHASPTAGFTPTADTLMATIETAQGGIAYIPTTVPLYVSLLARNTSGAASDPSAEVGPYAPKPVAGEIGIGEITETLIGDGAVTTPKVFTNAITTAKLDVGSVDATALKADAITGKIITGGEINGAEFHSDDGAGGLVDVQNGTVVTTAASGWKIVIDPTQPLPVLDFLNDAGITAGSINGLGDSARPGLVIASGPFTDGAITDWRWATRCGADGENNAWRILRTRESDPASYNGGYLDLRPARAVFAVADSANPTTNVVLQLDPGIFTLDGGRTVIAPPASSLPGILLLAKTGHTGALIRAQLDGADRFVVWPSGNATLTGTLTAADITITGQIIKDSAWSTLSTGTGWSGYGGAYGPGRYRKMPDGSVILRDLIVRTATSTPTNGDTVGTLPAGYRPITTVQQNVWVGGSTGGSLSVNINTNGAITLTNFSSGAVTYLSTGIGYLSLNGFQFFLD